MTNSVFAELTFWLLILFSVAAPSAIYGVLLAKRAISRRTVLIFGFALVIIAGIDVYLLQRLSGLAKRSTSLADDVVFVSELSVALYLLPALFGGIGINMVSHVLMRHLDDAEALFRNEHARKESAHHDHS
jgi:hypothetical protein